MRRCFALLYTESPSFPSSTVSRAFELPRARARAHPPPPRRLRGRESPEGRQDDGRRGRDARCIRPTGRRRRRSEGTALIFRFIRRNGDTLRSARLRRSKRGGGRLLRLFIRPILGGGVPRPFIRRYSRGRRARDSISRIRLQHG